MKLTKKQLAALRESRTRLRVEKRLLTRMAAKTENVDIDDAAGHVEDAIEWIGAAITNDKDDKPEEGED